MQAPVSNETQSLDGVICLIIEAVLGTDRLTGTKPKVDRILRGMLKIQELDLQRQSAARVEQLEQALRGMVENFSEYPCDNTERWREEHQAYENAIAALEQKEK